MVGAGHVDARGRFVRRVSACRRADRTGAGRPGASRGSRLRADEDQSDQFAVRIAGPRDPWPARRRNRVSPGRVPCGRRVSPALFHWRRGSGAGAGPGQRRMVARLCAAAYRVPLSVPDARCARPPQLARAQCSLGCMAAPARAGCAAAHATTGATRMEGMRRAVRLVANPAGSAVDPRRTPGHSTACRANAPLRRGGRSGG